MVSSSKILTVSYGTFSCTLEGFDDSFDTMKAIAEYFRDLAADDRYFGAEPPTPDAELLAKIAEKEIARRVEAHEDAGKIHLRADASTAPAIAGASPAVEETHAPAPAATPEREAAVEEETPLAEKAQAVEAEDTDETADDGIKDVIAAEDEAPADSIESLEAEEAEEDGEPQVALPEVEDHDAADEATDSAADDAVTASIESALAEAEAEAVEEAAEDDEAAEIVSLEDDGAAADDIEAELESALEADLTDGGDAAIEDAPEADAPETDVPETDVPEADVPEAVEETAEQPTEDDDDDSVAARLRRIRSVVAGGSADFETDTFSEDEHAQDFLNDTVSDLDAALMADTPEAAEMPERATSEILEDGAHDDALDRVAEELGMAQDTAFEEEADEIEDLAEDTLSQLLADAIPEDAPSEETVEDATEDNAEDAFDELASEMENDADGEELAETKPLRARVIKMKRSDFEAAVAEGALDESFDVLEDASDDDEPAEAILSPEDEADLQSELDAVAAELEADVEAMASDDDAAEDIDQDEGFEDGATETADDEDAYEEDYEEDDEDDVLAKGQILDATDRPVSRLFSEAQSHLSTPEATRRRNAIQHLRAAVEANEAETNAGSALRPEKDEGAYRSDIADAMRPPEEDVDDEVSIAQPRMPSRTRRDADRTTERPVEKRPAPLQLVAEQRVDMPQDPVRPRRVSAAHMSEPVDLSADSGSFRDFAEDIGATDLPDLLEAAAAYVSDVEGRPQFSRRALMGKIDEFAGDDFTREDRLKSFGQLLRHGKLQKLKGGQFTVTDETEYRTGARNAG